MPASGWALSGLAQALRAQGKAADADAMKPRLDRAWPLADLGLKTLR